jgi:hypothetical protein
MATPSKLEKLTIYPYKDETFSQSAGNSYEVLINPGSYTHNYSNSYNTKQASGTAAPNPRFDKTNNEKVGMELHFDATGITPGSSGDVLKDILKFKNIVYTFNGTIHSPNYLKLSWGTLLFNCVLTSLDVTYNLFKPDGTPLRAKVNVNFEGFLDEKTIALKEGKSSPDLTHIIVFKIGDKLPNLCYQIYGDSSYYIPVANYNKLIDFRDIKPGTKIFFPPIKS